MGPHKQFAVALLLFVTNLFVTNLFGSVATAAQPAIAAGGKHSLALKDDGTVWAWGDNSRGQAGLYNATAFVTLPAPLSTLSGVTAIAAGGYHNLALKSDGTVWAWGENADGQLAYDPANIPSLFNPLQVPISGVTAIAAGDAHSLALRNNGTVWAWGSNSRGQLGNGSTADSHVPIPVSGLSNVTAIAAGMQASFALKNDGTVWAWGFAGASTVPLQVPGLSDVRAIAGAYFILLALKSDGTVWAGVPDRITGALVPQPVSGLEGGVGIAAGGHVMAIKAGGTVWSFGSNQFGQLGTGSLAPESQTPVRAFGVDGAIAVSAGLGHSLMLKSDGTVWTWGANSSGQLGTGNTTEYRVPVQARYQQNPFALGFLNIGATVSCSGSPSYSTSGIACLPVAEVRDGQNTVCYNAALQWVPGASPATFALLAAKQITCSGSDNPVYASATGALTIPKIVVPAGGAFVQLYSAGLHFVPSPDATTFVLDSATPMGNPYIPIIQLPPITPLP